MLDPVSAHPDCRQLINQLLAEVASKADCYKEHDVTVHVSQSGRNYAGELLVVGRAVNGWSRGHLPRTLLDEECRLRAVDEAIKPSEGCSMAWVVSDWQEQKSADGNRRYNSARSAFWRVTRRALQGLSSEPEPPDWSSRLTWTNLYKVAPTDGGNPSGRLINVQRPWARELLKWEIHHSAPSHVLVLTGREWFDPFADALGFSEVQALARGHAQRAGFISLASRVACLVVAPHPQGKREKQLVADVLGTFKQLRTQVANNEA